jgi:biopolymer transport protein ExbB
MKPRLPIPNPSRIGPALSLILLVCLPCTARAAEAGTSLLELIRMGGWAMWPLMAGSIFACYCVVAVSLDLRASKCLPLEDRRQLGVRLNREGLDSTAEWLASQEKPGSQLLAETAARVSRGGGANRCADSLAEGLQRIEGGYAARIHQLSIVASIAPMIGLLGTVSGMIGAFQTISGGGMGRAEMLAGDIGEALITTAAGLIIGIPALVAYFILRGKLSARMVVLAELGETILDLASAGEEATGTSQPG